MTDGPLGEAASVDILLAFAKDVALADEQERQTHLDTKAGNLAGFVAVALSLESGLGPAVLRDDGLSGCQHHLTDDPKEGIQETGGSDDEAPSPALDAPEPYSTTEVGKSLEHEGEERNE